MKAPQAVSAPTLKTFLAERRARIRPEDVGLPHRARRAPGLSRQDVAELLEVSHLWYALFESGTSGRRVSSQFLERVATALRMDAADRATLLRLAASSGTAAREGEHGPKRLVAFMADLAEMARELATAESVAQAGEIALQTLGSLLASAKPEFTLLLRSGTELEAVAYAGPERDSPVVGIRVPLGEAACYAEVLERGSRAIIVTDVLGDDELSAVFRGLGCSTLRESFVHARSVIVAPVASDGELLGTIRIDSPFPNAFSEHEATIAEIVGSHLARVVVRSPRSS